MEKLNENYWFNRSYQYTDGEFDDDVWEIDTTKINNTWHQDSNYDYDRMVGGYFPHIVTYEDIPPSAIKLIHKGEGFISWNE